PFYLHHHATSVLLRGAADLENAREALQLLLYLVDDTVLDLFGRGSWKHRIDDDVAALRDGEESAAEAAVAEVAEHKDGHHQHIARKRIPDKVGDDALHVTQIWGMDRRPSRSMLTV